MSINLDTLKIYSATEASRILGKDDGYVRQMLFKYPDKFPKGSYRKFGKTIIVTQDAINALSQKKTDH